MLDVQRPVKGLVVHQVRVLEGELREGAELAAEVDYDWRLRACQAHSGTHVVHAALRAGARPAGAAVGLLQPAGLPAAGLRLAGRAHPAAAHRHRGRRQRRRPGRPRGHRLVHDAARGARVRRAGAVRRDLRRAGARRRDRRPVVARALRWHPRARQRADRHAGADRRVVGRLRRRAASRRSSGSRASGTWPGSATWSASSRSCSKAPAGRPGRAGQRHARPAARRRTRNSPSCAPSSPSPRPVSWPPPRRTSTGSPWSRARRPVSAAADLRTLALDVRGRLPATGRPWSCWRRSPVARWHSWPR